MHCSLRKRWTLPTCGLKLSFLLLDEIDKASDVLWQLLLGILDKAPLTLGDNRRVDLSRTVIFMTSNLGGGDITESPKFEKGAVLRRVLH